MASLIDRYRDQIEGVLSCYDRVVIRGTLSSVCHAKAMASTLDARGIRLFDYTKQFAEPLREAIRAQADRVAAEAASRSSTSGSRRPIGRKTASERS